MDLVPSGEGMPARGSNRFLDGMREQVLRNAREAVIRQAAHHSHRDSPFAAVDNQFPLVLRFDGETGKVLSEGQRASTEIQIRYQLRPDDNRLVLDPETTAALRAGLQELRPEQDVLRGILEALLELPRQPIVAPRGARPALEAAGTGQEAVVLPQADSGVFRFNQEFLSGKEDNGPGAIAMTVMFGGESAALKHWYLVGTLSLDAEGRIVGSAVGRPDFQSPRGTQYRNGMAVGADKVAVILHGETIVWLGPLGGLNPKQQSAMLALSGASASRRAQLQAEDPYAVDAILNQGMGRVARDVSEVIASESYRAKERRPDNSVRIPILVGYDAQGVLRAVPDVGRKDFQGPLEQVLGRVQVVVTPSQGRETVWTGGGMIPKLDRFEYRIDPGMPHREELEGLLKFLQKDFLQPEARAVFAPQEPKKLP